MQIMNWPSKLEFYIILPNWNKHFSLFGPFVSYKENKVLSMQKHGPYL
jgi:hypothetical protein